MESQEIGLFVTSGDGKTAAQKKIKNPQKRGHLCTNHIQRQQGSAGISDYVLRVMEGRVQSWLFQSLL